MAAESNVGARILIIGKDAAIAGVREVTAAMASLNAEIASGAGSSKVAAAGYAEQGAGLEALQAKMDLYQTNLAAVGAETEAVARVGKVAFLALGAAAAAWTYESVKWAQSYQTALVALRTQAGLTATAVSAIGKAAMANAAALGTTPTAYLQAAYHPGSTGMSTAETIAITNYAAKEAAIAGPGTSLEDTTNSLTSVMKAYGFTAKQAEPTIAKLNAIVGAGNMHFSDLNSALGTGIASTAKTFGVSLTSVGGALARLTDLGTPAAQAGTRLRMAIALLGAPSQAASTLIQDAGMTDTAAQDSQNSLSQTLYQAGVQPTELSAALSNNSGAGGIYNALALLKQNLAGSGLSKTMQDAMIARSFGGGRMGTSIMQLYSSLPALKEKSAQIDKGSTNQKYMQDWTKTTQTLEFQLKRLGGTIETLGTQFGLKLLPPLTDAVKAFTDIFGWLDKNKGVVMALGTAVTAVLVPAIGVYLKGALLKTNGALMTVFRGYGNVISGQTQEQLALARTDAALSSTAGATERLAAADAGLGGASETVAGKIALEDAAAGEGSLAGLGGRTSLSALTTENGGLVAGESGIFAGGTAAGLKAIAGKAGMGALIASMATPIANQYLRKPLQHILGKAGETVGMDAASGAMTGAFLGPEGMLAGAAIGALYGDRGHLARQVEVGAHDAAHGLDAARHGIASVGDDVWHGLFGGGSSKSSSASKGLTVHNHVTVKVDGKQIGKTVTKVTKATVARQ